MLEETPQDYSFVVVSGEKSDLHLLSERDT